MSYAIKLINMFTKLKVDRDQKPIFEKNLMN